MVHLHLITYKMKMISKYASIVPYFYFLIVLLFWFIDMSENIRLILYLLFLSTLPLIWDHIKLNKQLNLSLIITFLCLTSHQVLLYLFHFFPFESFTQIANQVMMFACIVSCFQIYNGLFEYKK